MMACPSGLVHAAWTDRRAALQALQTGDLFSLLANNLLQGADLDKQINQESFKL